MTTTALLEPSTAARRVVRDCQVEARDFLARLVGRPHSSVCWDPTHQLQGHAVVDGQELILIAPRDAAHEPVVFTAADWDEIQHSPSERRTALLCSCRITSRRRLRDALAA